MRYMQDNLSVKDRSRLEQAKRIAAESDCNYKHGCVAVIGGRVVSVGVNSYRNDISVFDSIPEDTRSFHAEIACLKALGGKAEGATFYVARVNNHGEERMSKPCVDCQTALRSAGVKRVVYTIDSELNL